MNEASILSFEDPTTPQSKQSHKHDQWVQKKGRTVFHNRPCYSQPDTLDPWYRSRQFKHRNEEPNPGKLLRLPKSWNEHQSPALSAWSKVV